MLCSRCRTIACDMQLLTTIGIPMMRYWKSSKHVWKQRQSWPMVALSPSHRLPATRAQPIAARASAHSLALAMATTIFTFSTPSHSFPLNECVNTTTYGVLRTRMQPMRGPWIKANLWISVLMQIGNCWSTFLIVLFSLCCHHPVLFRATKQIFQAYACSSISTSNLISAA